MQTMAAQIGTIRMISVAGCNTEIWEGGEGRPLLYLHPGDGFDPAAAFVGQLAARYRLIVPSHPGFGASDLPAMFSTVDDLAYFYLDLIDQLGLDDLVIVGLSFGGWIAAEIAIKNTTRIAGLVMAGALGVRFADRLVREITDPFSVLQYEQDRLWFHDQRLWNTDYTRFTEEELCRLARNHESYSIFGWSPTLHNPKLRQRLHRIDVPTQFLWGEYDRMVSPDYGRKYAAEIPGAGFTLIPDAGHYIHIEKPEAFTRGIDDFVRSLPVSAG